MRSCLNTSKASGVSELALRNWYVLQVISGHEKEIADKLRAAGIRSAVPEHELMIRRGGEWKSETRLIFPSYVFICCQYTADIYHTAKRTPGVIKILPNAIYPVPLHPHEADFIKICSRGTIGLHDVVKCGSEVRITSGELADFCGKIVMLRPRQRKAVIKITLRGYTRLISIGINHIVTKSEEIAG